MTQLIVSDTIAVAAPPERVWRALTDPAELILWYAPGCRWEIATLAVGASVQFFNSATDIQPATIITVAPARCLALRWHPDPALPMATLRTTYVLTRTASGTTISLEHDEYESVPVDQREAWLSADREAVPAILAALAGYLAGAA
jgi:uncharacterized protein YndB with AHSA1/START domain